MRTGLLENFKTNIEYEMGKSFLVLELANSKEKFIYNYQVEMIANNPNTAIIPFEVRRKNDEIKLYYNITSKVQLKDYLRTKELSKPEFIEMLSMLANTLLESVTLLLYEKNFALNEENIYVEPGSGKLSLLYLPFETNAQHGDSLKDLVIGLIIKSARMEIRGGDSYLQEIIEYVKTDEFNISDFNKLLGGIKNKRISNTTAQHLNKDSQPENFEASKLPSEEGLHLTVPSKKASEADAPSLLKRKNQAKGGLKNTMILLLTQLAVISAAVTGEAYMNAQGVAEDTRYISIGMFVLVVDLLLYKHLYSKKKGETQDKAKGRKLENINNKEDLNFKKPGKRSFLKFNPKKSKCNYDYKSKNLQDEVINHEEKVIPIVEKIEPSKGGYRPVAEETTLLCPGNIKGTFLEREDNGVLQRVEIDKKRFIIGRDSGMSDMVIPENPIGRVHAEIIMRDDEYFISDRHSKNGTYLNDVKLQRGREYKLGCNDNIVLANIEYRFVVY